MPRAKNILPHAILGRHAVGSSALLCDVMFNFNVIHTPCNGLTLQYLIRVIEQITINLCHFVMLL